MDSLKANYTDLPSCFQIFLTEIPCGGLDSQLYSTNGSLIHAIGSSSAYAAMIVYPILLLLSFVGNGTALYLLIKNSLKSGHSAMLITLCISSTILICMDLPGYVGLYYEGYRTSLQYLETMDGILGFVMWIQQGAGLIVSGVLSSFAISRLVWRPKVTETPGKQRQSLTWRVSIIICSVIAMAAYLICVPYIVFFDDWHRRIEGPKRCSYSAEDICDWISPWTRFRKSVALSIMDLVIVVIMVIGITVANSAFALLVIRGRKPKIARSSPKESPLTVVLVRLSLFYLCTHLPKILFFFPLTLSYSQPCLNLISVDHLTLWGPLAHLIFLSFYALSGFFCFGLIRTVKQRKLSNISTLGPEVYQLVPMKENAQDGNSLAVPKEAVIGGVFEPMIKKNVSFYMPKTVGKILNDQQFQELWTFLPFRNRIYQPKLVFTSDEDGTSITNFLTTLEPFRCSVVVVKTMNDEIFGAYCGSSWADRNQGKRTYEYFGTGETFLFCFDPKMKVYPWVGLCGRATTAESNLFMAADATTLIIGGGGGEAICFEESLARGFTGSCLTFKNPPFCESGEFEAALLEVYAPSDEMVA